METMITLTHAIQKETLKADWTALEGLFTTQHSDFIKKNPQCIVPMLENLAVGTHSAGWCQILSRVQSSNAPAAFLDLVERFFAGMDVAQVRDAGTKDARLGAVSHTYTEMCIARKKPGRGVPHLLHGLQRLRPSTDVLTPLHSDYLCLCLLQKQYSLAADLLSSTIYDVGARSCGTTPRDFLLFYYYSGMVYIGLKQFEKARNALETCICCPASCLSAIALEAYKKLLLVNLLLHGKAYSFTKQCPFAVSKMVGKYCPGYLEYASVFESGDRAQMVECIAQYENVFVADKNLGLVKQTKSHYIKQSIKNLTATYETLSLSDIADAVGLSSTAEVATHLEQMVASGTVCARIDATKQMAHFEDEEDNSSMSCAILSHEINAIKHLTERMAALDDSLKCSKEYALKKLSDDPDMKARLMAQKVKKGNVMDMFSFVK